MVEINWQPLSSKWQWLATQKWSGASGTWETNGYQDECIISITEGIEISDRNIMTPSILKKEEFRVSSSYWDNIKYVMRILEHISITEQISKVCGISVSELLNTEDVISSKAISRTFFESLNILSKYIDKRKLSRMFTESFGLSDKHHNILGKIENEQIKLLIEQMGNSNAVISDIIISTNEIPTNVPAGYEQWRPFVSGDYTYKDALIKCVLTSSSLDYVALLSSFKVFVDLPDLQDHDVTDVPAEKHYIPFNLEFYRIPDVTITTIGATEVVIPHITEVDLEGFYVELRNVQNELATGKISWQALGC